LAEAFWRTVVLQKRTVVAALAAILAIAVLPHAAQAQDKSITVFAAASMKNALDDVDAAFTKQSGVKVVASYDASSALMKQIEGGAPADVFVSADLKWMDYGSQKKLIKDDTRANLLGNELVLIAAKDSKIGNVTIAPGFDLAGLASDRRRESRPRRALCASRLAEARRVGGRRAEDGDDRERAGGAGTGGSRRGAARHRLFDRRQGRARRQNRRHVPGELARSNHLSGRSDGECQNRCGAVSGISALCGGQDDFRVIRLYGFDKADDVKRRTSAS
jgi:hypothetical protein